jgi:hypothetical protein
MNKLNYWIVFFCYFLLQNAVNAQITVKGKLTDASTGEAVPFANVFIRNSGKVGTGVNTDFDGYYNIKVSSPQDSIIASYIGYKDKGKLVSSGKNENGVYILNFQLETSESTLNEVRLTSGEDPAYGVMRKVLANKDKHDKRKLPQYDQEVYTKIELDIDNVADKFSKRKPVQKVMAAIDSTGGLTGEDGKPLIPIFMSESISRYYVQNNPDRTKEIILKTKIDGVGLNDNSSVSQIIGSSFQEYNFYKNWMNIFAKDFVSPLADSWKSNYDYFLADTVVVSDRWCYKIEITPHRKEDLAFEGIIWIDTTSFALKQIDVGVDKRVNVNFLEKMRIQQELDSTALGPWLPIKTRVMVNVAQVNKNTAGLLAKFYTSNRDIVLNKRYPLKFFQQQTEVKEDAHLKARDPQFWAQARHDSLTPAEIKTYALIDTIKQVPVVKAYSNIIAVISSGYYTWRKIDVGNYTFFYAFNDVEGHRIMPGFRTNEFFSTKFELKAYGGYGTQDQRFKYYGRLRYIPYRKLWTEIGVESSYDITQFAVNPDGVAVPGAFLASLNFFSVSKRTPFYRLDNNAYIQRDIIKGVTQKVRFRNIQFEQIGQHFAYYTQYERGTASPANTNFNITELTFETRLAKDERFYFIGNYRTSLGTAKLPVVTLRYTRGFAGLLGGDFDYHKFAVAFEQNLGLGTLGRSYYVLTASYTPSRVPYPLLEVHLGNRGYFYNFYGFGLMNFLEFVSDQHIGLNYEHNFSGLLFNRLPLFRKLKWRTFVAANMLVGSLRDENRYLIPDKFPDTDIQIVRPNALDYRPYVEVGYGISNILKFLRVTFLHRLTYLDQQQGVNQPPIRKFGVFFSTRFEL